jgi:hypothetical protein
MKRRKFITLLDGGRLSELAADLVRRQVAVIATTGGRASGAGRSDENDPSPTLAVHCGIGFDADFSPYQSTRSGRYNAVP